MTPHTSSGVAPPTEEWKEQTVWPSPAPPPTRVFVEVAEPKRNKKHFAAFEVRLWRPGLRNEVAFANRQEWNDAGVKGSGGSFHYFSWGGSNPQPWLQMKSSGQDGCSLIKGFRDYLL